MINTSLQTANFSLNSPHQLLDYYLQVMHDSKVRQIKTFATWADVRYSRSFKEILIGQQRLALQQRDSLKALERVFDVFLSGVTCRPVQCFLQEADEIVRFLENDIDLTEPLIAQLIYFIKHYELVTSRSALTLARQIEEPLVASKLAKIALEDGRASIRLQDFMIERQKNKKIVTNRVAT